ncbi:acyltransferase family protein, partial [Romboutsia sp.]|uniref:acyltransferase family protein n=1 Tax=Romboutsia sp. TaxID=1965302 RepID=UPI003F3F0527
MVEENKNNLYFVDNLKVILIFLVVFGHLIERYIETNSTLMGIYMFIYSFHMPLFVFISGFLSKNINKSRKIFFKSLLVPYVIFNIIWYSLAYLYTGKTNIPILYPGWTLWFLLSLFFWRMSLRYLVKIKYILPISFLLGLLVGFISNGSILSFSRTIVFLPFFLLGYYADMKKLNEVSSNINFNEKLATLGVIAFFILALFISENNILDYRFLYGSYSYSELSINLYQGLTYRLILYVVSILLSLFICKIIPNKKTFYTGMGKSTMYIYSFHIYVVLIIFYLIPTWNNNIVTNWIILTSPLFITYILSRKIFETVYNLMFSPI